jgi:Tfp pilus assembly protein PilF
MPKNKAAIIYVLLAVAAFASFWQVNHSGFIDLDDKTYVTENMHVRNGLTAEGALWGFGTGRAANWHPLTWMSHMLDVELFGLDPHRHHLINLLFHVANSLLLFFVLHVMTKGLWQSAFVAALFALHPLHVESVAWVAERKDVLSTLFWLLTMASYFYYVQRPKAQRYVLVLVFFACGLMAKPMLVTLPFVLLILDYWPLNRLRRETLPEARQTKPVESANPGKQRTKTGKKKQASREERTRTAEPVPSASSSLSWKGVLSLAWEKVPLFALSMVSSIVTFLVQQKGGAVGSAESFPLVARIENALVSYVVYIGKMFWPTDLAVFYPHPGSWPVWQVLGAGLFLAVVTWAALRTARRSPYVIAGWLWYLGTLVPVIGLVQVGQQARADRYTYVPLIGLFIIVSWGIPALVKKWRHGRKVLAACATVVLSCFFIVTWTQVGYWRDDFTLFGHAVTVVDDNHSAYCSRGNVYAAEGRHRQAIRDYDEAIRIKPGHSMYYHNRGSAYAALGDQRRAIEDYDKAITIEPRSSVLYNSRGNAYARLGVPKQAIEDYGRAIAIEPSYAWAYANRGSVYGALGDYDHAMEDFNRAIALDPQLVLAYRNRGQLNRALGNGVKAYEDLKTAASLGDEASRALLRDQGVRW